MADEQTETEQQEPTTNGTATATVVADLGDGGKKAIDAERKARAESDKRAKALEVELEKLREQTMSDHEKAVATAKAEGRTEGLREAAPKVVDAEIRAAALGRSVDVDALLEGLDRSKFITEAGDADRAAIETWIERVAPIGEPGPQINDGLGSRRRTPVNTALAGDPLEADLRRKLGIT